MNSSGHDDTFLTGETVRPHFEQKRPTGHRCNERTNVGREIHNFL